MKKNKIGLFICLTLILSAFIPTITVALAGSGVKPKLEKVVIVHYRRGFGKPKDTPGNGPSKGDGGEYSLLGKGVKWKETVEIFVDPAGSNLDGGFVLEAVRVSAEEWDDGEYSGWGGVQVNLVDGYSLVQDGTFDDEVSELDGRNELVFGDYPKPGVIAVTIIWGYFNVPPKFREIVEFDIMFDTDYPWGDAEGDSSLMDLQNIATHELGHGLGLADLYDSSASQETMYGYSTYGETSKRDLYKGDKAGILELYG